MLINDSFPLNTKVNVLLVTALAILLSGCSLVVDSISGKFTDNLSQSIVNQTDPATVKAAIPAYLLLIDSFLEDDPYDESMLRSAATLYGVYAGMLDDQPLRRKKLADKAFSYGQRAVCARDRAACNIHTLSFEKFAQLIDHLNKNDIPSFYALGTAWAGWIQASSNDWNAIAQLSQVELIMKTVVKLNEHYDNGSAHMYLGVMATLLPLAMGGRPDEGRRHFERAIVLSEGKHLMHKVLYAQQYARLMFDRELHDRLLTEVVNANVKHPGLTLINTLAQEQAEHLLRSADDFF